MRLLPSAVGAPSSVMVRLVLVITGVKLNWGKGGDSKMLTKSKKLIL